MDPTNHHHRKKVPANSIAKTELENSNSLKSISVEEELFLKLKKDVEDLKRELLEIKEKYATKEKLEEKLDKKDAVVAYGEKKSEEEGEKVFQEIFSDVPRFRFIRAIGLEHLTGYQLSKRGNYRHPMIYNAINAYYKAGKRVTLAEGSPGGELQRLIHAKIIKAEKHKTVHDDEEHDIYLSDKGKLIYGLKIFS